LPTQLLRVVRGEIDLGELPIGLAAKRGPTEWYFSVAATKPPAPLPQDVARGLHKLLPHPGKAQEWAAFLLAAAPLLNLEQLSESPEAEALLDALWDISAGNIPPESELNRLTTHWISDATES